jgi:hypothetical protein
LAWSARTAHIRRRTSRASAKTSTTLLHKSIAVCQGSNLLGGAAHVGRVALIHMLATGPWRQQRGDQALPPNPQPSRALCVIAAHRHTSGTAEGLQGRVSCQRILIAATRYPQLPGFCTFWWMPIMGLLWFQLLDRIWPGYHRCGYVR